MTHKKERKLQRKKSIADRALSDIADAMNRCLDLKIEIKPKHGILMSREGYVVQLANGRWGARTLNFTEFALLSESYGEED